MSLFVKLNKLEIELVSKLAKARRKHNQKVKRNDLLKADKSKADFIELNGLAGEFAVAKALNLYPDTDPEVISRYDLILPSGKRLEIKTTEHKTGKLIVRELNSASYYVLVTGTYDKGFDILGYVEAKTLAGMKKPWYESEVYLADQSELVPIEKLLSKAYLRILGKAGYHESRS